MIPKVGEVRTVLEVVLRAALELNAKNLKITVVAFVLELHPR